MTVTQDGKLLVPATSSTGIDVISSNMLLENETDPVIWRGPVIAGAVKQFWSETLWQDIDYMFVASGNRRCAADRIPVSSGQRDHHRDIPAGACLHDR